MSVGSRTSPASVGDVRDLTPPACQILPNSQRPPKKIGLPEKLSLIFPSVRQEIPRGQWMEQLMQQLPIRAFPCQNALGAWRVGGSYREGDHKLGKVCAMWSLTWRKPDLTFGFSWFEWRADACEWRQMRKPQLKMSKWARFSPVWRVWGL